MAIAVLKGPNLEYTLVNPTYQELVGVETPLVGRTYGEVVPEVAERGAEAALHRVINTGRPWHIEDFGIELPGRTGLTYWEGECVPLPNEQGLVDSVLVMAREITERKQKEAAAGLAAAALRDREERYALVVAGAAAAIWDWDVRTRRVDYSPRWRELRGLAQNEVSDSEEEWAKSIHPDDAPRVMAAVQAHFEGKTPVFAEEYRVRHKDGSWVWILDRGLAHRDDDGTVLRMAGSEIDITERRRAEATLRESEARYRSLVSVVTDVPWTRDARGAFAVPQEAWSAYTGQTWEEYRGVGWINALHPEDRDRVGGAWSAAVDARSAYESRGRLWHAPSASWRHVVARATPMLAADGTVREWVGACTDVEDSVQAAQALRASEERYREIFYSAGVAIWDEDFSGVKAALDALKAQGVDDLRRYLDENPEFVRRAVDMVRIRDVNPAAVRMLGAREPQELTASLDLVFTDETRSAFVEELVAIAEGHTRFQADTAMRTLDGQRLEVVASIAFPPPDGDFSRVPVMLLDITERKRAEEALRESEARKSAVLETALDSIISMDHRGKVVEFNPAAERTFGYRREEVLGRELAGLIIPEPLRARHRSALTRHLATGASSMLGRRVEMAAMRADGTTFPVELTVSRMPTAGPALFTAYLRDVTDRREAEAAVREANRRKDEFLATLSHELRNPLAPLRNALHLLRRARVEGELADSLHDVMERQINHLVRLVDDLMEVSRITRGSFELRRESVTIQEVLRSAFETSQPLIEAGGHRLSVSMPPEPHLLEVDPVRLAQVFTNLLNNAAKYTPEGGDIEVDVREEPDHVVVSVSDSGQGIEAKDLSALFDMFSRGSRGPRDGQAGLGIGLALVRRLVEMHGGTVEAESQGAGQGSRFTVRLPIGDPAPSADNRKEPMPGPAPHRVLVVDDNHDAADTLGLLFSFLGADVVVRHDGPSALDTLDSYRPTMVLLDIGMPGMDGYEVARAIRSRERGSRTPLIAITGWGQERDKGLAEAAGFDHHLVKPAQVEVLKALLASLPGTDSAS